MIYQKKIFIFNIILKINQRFKIWKKLFYLFYIIHLKIMCWIYFSHKMVVEMVFNNKMQFVF
jgi:hypothetical protein